MRLIDADALIAELEHDIEIATRDLNNLDLVETERDIVEFDRAYKENAIYLLRDTPTTEPKKGKWMGSDDNTVTGHCSVCGWEALRYETDVAGMPFCPNCGAYMVEEEDGEENG